MARPCFKTIILILEIETECPSCLYFFEKKILFELLCFFISKFSEIVLWPHKNILTYPAEQSEIAPCTLLSVLLHFQHYCFSFILYLFPIVSKLNGQSVIHTAEGSRLHLPVVNWVTIETDAIIEASLNAKTSGTEVIYVHLADVVGMKVDNLKVLHIRQTLWDFAQAIVFQMQLPQIWDIW